MMSRRRLNVGSTVLGMIFGLLALFSVPASAARHPAEGSFGAAAQPSFGRAAGMAVEPSTGDLLVIDMSNQTLSRYHADGTPATFSILGTNVIDGKAGADETPQSEILSSFGNRNEVEVAVDSSGGGTDGNIYVTDLRNHVIDVFAESGGYLGQLSEFTGGALGETCGVTVDLAGNVYVGDYTNGIHKYVPSANFPVNGDNTATFTEVGNPCSLSHGGAASANSLFASSYTGTTYKLNAATGEVSYIVAEGSAGLNSVDPGTGHVYVAREATVEEYDVSGASGASRVSRITAEAGVEGVAIDGDSGKVYLARAGALSVQVFGPLGPPVPFIEHQQVVSAVFAEASLKAEVNPEGSSTTSYVEYGNDASYGAQTSVQAVGTDEANHTVVVNLAGLTPNTTYHYRFVATNGIGTTEGPDQTFKTFSSLSSDQTCSNQAFRVGPAGRLPNCRAYEMVSPVDKNNTDILSLIEIASNPAALDQSATDGEKITYTTSQGFGDTQGAPYVSQYIASRTPGGWKSHSITPPQGLSDQNVGKRIDLEFRLFSPDLCDSLLLHWTDPPLAAGAPEDVPNIYQRENCGAESYKALSVIPHGGGNEVNPNVQGLSADGRCGVFEVEGLLTEGLLYESCEGNLRLVSVLPFTNGEPAANGVAGTGFGNPSVSLRSSNMQGAVSADGSRVYWTPSQGDGPLYIRENAQEEQSALGLGGKCTELDKACTIPVSGTVSEGANAIFWGASPDGSRAFYSLEETSSSGRLYEFDLATDSSTLVAAGVTGVMGVDRGATRIYLSSREEVEGQGVAGKPNLYFFDSTRSSGERFRFLGTLTEADGELKTIKSYSPVNFEPYKRTARISPDGLHAVFTSRARLTGYDNTDSASGEADFEVFVYDATGAGGAGQLHCVSCNPSGQPPTGRNVLVEGVLTSNWAAALIPPYATAFYGSRAISDDGRRVFFNSYEDLIPSDTNGKDDVYEWEAAGGALGEGRCTQANPTYSPPNGGCISLISSGESPSNSEFVDASSDGRDVFFTTASSLVPQDPGLIDIYDAREMGGFPPPLGQPAACEGEACQSPVSPPNDPTPASATFHGAGNVKPKKKCQKPKKKCHQSKKKCRKAKKKCQRRADVNRRAAR